MKPGDTGLQRIIKATGYSWQGLRAAWQHEAAFRQELIACIVLLPLAFSLAPGKLELLLLLGSLFLVLICEILNSAIEAVVDRLGDDYHELSGRAKDMGSAAVFLALTCSTIIWLSILLPV